MARLAFITYFALIIASVLGAAIPPPSLIPFLQPPIFIPTPNASNSTLSRKHYTNTLPLLPSSFHLSTQTHTLTHPHPRTDPDPAPAPAPALDLVSLAKKPAPLEPAKPARRPQTFTPAKIARCIFTLALGPCCSPLSNPPPRSQECIDKWGDPDYDRQDEINFCDAQPLGKCTITDMDGVPQNMVPKVEG